MVLLSERFAVKCNAVRQSEGDGFAVNVVRTRRFVRPGRQSYAFCCQLCCQTPVCLGRGKQGSGFEGRAEEVGFEPTKAIHLTRFPVVLTRPL
jgi:hypothetical protein